MGLLNELKRLTRPYDEDDEFEEFPAERTETPARENKYSSGHSSQQTGSWSTQSGSERRQATQTGGRDKVVNIHATTQLAVVLVKPERFENAAEIADHLRDKRTVVLNLESTNKDIARRLIDFLSGVAYAQEGKIKKVAVSTYIITPYNVDIMGDLIDELENNGLYF